MNWKNNEDAGDMRMMHDADASEVATEDIPKGGILINPKFKSRCKVCGRPICRKGKAVWVKGHGTFHPACYPHSTKSPRHQRPRRVIKVHCSKCGWVDEATVAEFLNIEEGVQGEDRVDFRCKCGKVNKRSMRVG
jgi:hypothetical protein